MRNITKIFLDSAPSRFKLGFGVNVNVMLKTLHNRERRDKNGVKIKKNCYLTFAAVDVEDNNKVLSESVFSYFNIDKAEYAVENFVHHYQHMLTIARAVVPADSIKGVLKVINDVAASNVDLFQEILLLSQKQLKPDGEKTKEIGALQNTMVNAYVEAMLPFVGEKGDLISLLVITDRKGKFFDLPREDKGFIGKMSGRKLTIDSKYVNWYADRNKVEKDENEDIGDEKILDESEIIIEEEDQNLEGI